jgi:hypothetical protein
MRGLNHSQTLLGRQTLLFFTQLHPDGLVNTASMQLAQAFDCKHLFLFCSEFDASSTL